MIQYLKRLFPVFLSVSLFSVIVMLCCIRGSDNKITMTPVDAAHPSVTSGSSVSKKEHVFHQGEMRGLWIPYFSLSNGNETMSENEFHTYFDSIVQKAKDSNINTLFVHVRSHCDAVYPSKEFPFSAIFTGSSAAPDYDPLEYMIKAAHKAGLEFHAWVNPYRVLSNGTLNDIPPESPCYKWLHDSIDTNDRNVIECSGGVYLNPARPEARKLIIDGVREIAAKYDVDGIHLDDYFYMFTESEYDDADYKEYNGTVGQSTTVLPLDKWRCANVSILVSGMYAAVKNIDSTILFGISPQGNIDNDIAMGADVYTWCEKYGYLDYIAPQIYVNFENEILPFDTAVDTWKDILSDSRINLYIGLALYKSGSDEDNGTWKTGEDIIGKEIEYTRTKGTDGYILYSYEYLDRL